MNLPKSLTTVTLFSKILAIVLFILWPFVGFYLGMQYQALVSQQTESSQDLPAMPSLAEKQGHPKLESVLYYLTQTDDYYQFARINWLGLKDNMVEVTIEVSDINYKLSPAFGYETARYENKFDAYVKIDKLLDLADDPQVVRIDHTQQPIPLNVDN